MSSVIGMVAGEDVEGGRSALDMFILKQIDFVSRRKCAVCCCSIFWLIFIILFGTSFKTLGPYKYGLLQNTVSRKVDLETVYEPGVYMIGFWNSFLTFPSTIQTIQYSFDAPEEGVQHISPLHLRSNDAVPIHLEVSVQYKRKKDELPLLFQAAMTDILQENIFTSNLRAELTKVMSRHNAADCWQKREELLLEFKAACAEVLERTHATCWGMQFYRSHMDDKYEEELVATQVQKQQERIEEAKKNAAEVRADTRIVLANYTNRIKVLESQGAAERYNLKVAAETQATVNKVNAEASALAYVMEVLKLPDGTSMTQEQMTEYQKALMLGDSLTSSQLFYGLSASPQYVAMSGGGSSMRRLNASEGDHQATPAITPEALALEREL